MSIEVQDLVAGYYEDLDILHNVSINVKKLEITAIIGPNGAGKSTLFKAIYGFLRPKKGKILFNGEDITGLPPREMLRKGISYVPQGGSVFPYLTVQENLELGGWILRSDRKLLNKRIEEIYDRYPPLQKKMKMGASFLSGGELKMLEVGRALITNPSVILVDEPTAGLAPNLFDQLYEQLKALSKTGKTIILVDQNVRAAIELSDYVYVLELGENKCQGKGDEFRSGTARELIKEWLTF